MGTQTEDSATEAAVEQYLQELTRALPPLKPAQEEAARQWLTNLIAELPPPPPDSLRHHVEELQQGLRQAQEFRLRYQELFEFAPEGYLVTDANGIISEANHAAAALLETRKEFLVGKPFGLMIRPEQRKQFYARLHDLGHLGGPRDYWEVTLQRPGHTARTVRASVTTSPFSDGHPVIFRWLLHDVTAQRQAEEALQAQRHFADTVFQTAPVLLLVLDPHGRILRSNAFCRVVAGYTEEDLHGREWCELLGTVADGDIGRVMLERARDSGAAVVQVLPLRTRDGRSRTIAWDIQALDSPLNGERTFLLVGHDITALQQAQQVALQRERLAAIGEMMTGLAHESRNALQRSQACLQRLRWRLHDQTDSLELLERALQAQDDIVRLFDDVRSYAAPVALALARWDLATIWREAWRQVMAGSPGREASLTEDTADLDLYCRVDRYRLSQVFRNALENSAAAVTGPLRVSITCRPAHLAGRDALRISVIDNGPGLDAEQRRRIFEPFYTTKTKGTGLGMPISRRIVEAHGGQITVGEGGPPVAEIVLVLPRDGP
jgi:PAS domain S-box-containing protein